MLITFEGIDGSGKSTLARLTQERLEKQGNSVLRLREPGSTKLGNSIREILKSDTPRSLISELFLFLSSRADLVENTIIPNIDKYDYILLDRYIDSTIAYQGFGNQINKDTINILNEIATSGIKPDKTFLIQTSFENSRYRIKDRNDNKDKFDLDIEFAQRVIKGYETIYNTNKDRIIKINNDRNIEDTLNEILSYL